MNDKKLIPENVPFFPNFRKIRLEDKQWYENYYKCIQPVSDLSFNNLIVWLDLADNLELSQLNGSIILQYGDPFASLKTSIAVVSDELSLDTTKTIFAYQKNRNIIPSITMATCEAVCNLTIDEIKKLNIIYDVDNSDYVVDIDKNYRINLTCNKHFRREINSFIKLYGDNILIKDYDLKSPTDIQTIQTALTNWGSNFSVGFNEKNKLGAEGFALEKLFANSKYLGSKCIGIVLNKNLIGFVIYYLPPQDGYAIGNHLKCDYSYKYISDFIYFCVLSRLHSLGIKYFNVEQDLGIEGIRKHKRSMHPEFMIKRFCVEPIKTQAFIGTLSNSQTFVDLSIDNAETLTFK